MLCKEASQANVVPLSTQSTSWGYCGGKLGKSHVRNFNGVIRTLVSLDFNNNVLVLSLFYPLIPFFISSATLHLVALISLFFTSVSHGFHGLTSPMKSTTNKATTHCATTHCVKFLNIWSRVGNEMANKAKMCIKKT